MATNCCAALYEEGQGSHGDAKKFFLHPRRRNPKDPRYKERCWAEFSINGFSRGISRRKICIEVSNFSRPRTGGMPIIFA